MLAYIAAAVGFVVTLMVTVFLMGELMPRSFLDWQRASKNRPAIVGMAMFALALVGGYIGYRLAR